jgi:Zn-dependent protease with chaperone function
VDLGVLLSLPLESVAIRLILAMLLAIAFVRLLLRAGLRTPGARVATALAPVAAIAVVLALSWGSLHLPALMLPVEAADALPIPVRDGYLHFAPMAVPLLVTLWGVLVASRIVRRAHAVRAARETAAEALEHGSPTAHVILLAERLAQQLRVPSPEVAVVDRCPGGAYVVGSRRPVLVLSDELAHRLDRAELEGVIAHELAHVRRHDNLVATVVGVVRDLTFFIPGGGWALRQLHRERELAADQVAVGVTGRPGALASGLLKVLEVEQGDTHVCAALAPSGTLVSRVRVLVEDAPEIGPVRRGAETIAVVLTSIVAIVLAIAVPAMLAGADRERDALALVWASLADPGSAATASYAEPRAFDVYRRSSLGVGQATAPTLGEHGERSADNRRSTLHACLDDALCPEASSSVGLGLAPRPTITVDHELTRRWEATPVVSGERDGFQVFWLQRVQ